MKNIKLILAGVFFLFLSLGVMAQGGPPDPPGDHGDDQDQPGGGAPIGTAIYLLIGLAGGYGAKKVYHLQKNDK